MCFVYMQPKGNFIQYFFSVLVVCDMSHEFKFRTSLCGIVSELKCFDVRAFQISEFWIRDVQPVLD